MYSQPTSHSSKANCLLNTRKVKILCEHFKIQNLRHKDLECPQPVKHSLFMTGRVTPVPCRLGGGFSTGEEEENLVTQLGRCLYCIVLFVSNKHSVTRIIVYLC